MKKFDFTFVKRTLFCFEDAEQDMLFRHMVGNGEVTNLAVTALLKLHMIRKTDAKRLIGRKIAQIEP